MRLLSRGGVTRDVEMDVRHFSISSHSLYRGDSFVGTHGVARDITERKFQETKRAIMQQVREAVWSMIGAEDIQQILEAIRTGLDTMGVRHGRSPSRLWHRRRLTSHPVSASSPPALLPS